MRVYPAVNKRWRGCATVVSVISNHIHQTKWPPFCRRYYEMHFHDRKVLYFDSNFTEFCSQGSDWQYASNGSGNGLAPNRQQATTWTNANIVHWRIYAAPGPGKMSYRNWYQDWAHCGVTNDLGSSPQPEGDARGLWWASQVVGDNTMTEIEVSISILSWCLKAY